MQHEALRWRFLLITISGSAGMLTCWAFFVFRGRNGVPGDFLDENSHIVAVVWVDRGGAPRCRCFAALWKPENIFKGVRDGAKV